MKPTGESNSFVLPPALFAEVEAAAGAEHRPVADVVRELVETGLSERRRSEHPSNDDKAEASPRYTPAQAGARLRELRKGRFLPEGETDPASSETSPAKRTPAEAAARILAHRPFRRLPEGETIRSMIEHGRA